MSEEVATARRTAPPEPRAMTCGSRRGAVGSIRETAPNGFVRRIDFEPGYDCWTVPCGKGHGRHGMQMRFLLMGEMGVTQFLMSISDWTPGSVDNIGHIAGRHGAMASDLGHHWLTPTYEGEMQHDACEYLHGANCFYDGSGLNAEPVLAAFVNVGVDAVWVALEDYWLYCAESAGDIGSSVPQGHPEQHEDDHQQDHDQQTEGEVSVHGEPVPGRDAE